jgi:MFS family permease
MTGTDAAFVALAYEVYRLTNSTVWLSATLLLTFGITGVLRPLAGALGDRYDRRRIMVASEALGAVTFGTLAFMHTPTSLLIVAFIAAVVETPFGPAGAAALPNLVESEDDLAWANSRLSVSSTIGGTVGPAIGGAIAGFAGASSVFWLNAVSFAISAAVIARVSGRFSTGSTGRSEHGGIMAGFSRIRADRLLMGLAIAWTMMYFAVDLVLVGDLPLAKSFGVGSFGYGLFLTAWSGAAVIGYWVAGKMRREQERSALIAGAAMVAVGYVTTAWSRWFPVALIGVGIAGGFDAVGNVAGYTLIQRSTPDEVRARVFGSLSSLGLMANAVAYIAAGFLVGALGPRPVYVIGASVAVVATGVLVWFTRALEPAT